MINNRFVCLQTLETYTKLKEAGELSDQSLIFIKETGLMITHGIVFSGQPIDDTELAQAISD